MRPVRALLGGAAGALVLAGAATSASADVELAPVSRLPFPERGYVVGVSKRPIWMPAVSSYARTGSASPTCASTRWRRAASASASCSLSTRATAWRVRLPPPRWSRRARSCCIGRTPRKSASSPSTARSRCCESSRLKAPLSGAPLRHIRRSSTAPGSMTLWRGPWRCWARQSSPPGRSSSLRRR